MKKLFLILLFLFFVGGYFVWDFAWKPNPNLTTALIIDIPPGTDFGTLLNILNGDRLELSRYPSKAAAHAFHLDKKIHHGEFELTPPMSSLDILLFLGSGKFYTRKLLVKEGFNIWDIT